MNTRSVFACTLIVCLGLGLVTSACGAVESVQAFRQAGLDFMTALKEGNYDGAYAQFAPELQQEVGDAGALRSMIEDNQAQPAEWSFTSFETSTKEGQQTAKLEGNVTYQDGRQGAVTLELLKVGEEWKLTSFNLTW